MAGAIDPGDLAGLLECSICLEQYDNPKLLACAHSFCKRCLEDIVKFNGDGSASITCPLRCTEETQISENSTVNDLKSCYDIKNIIDAIAKRKGKKTITASHVCTDEGCISSGRNEMISMYFKQLLMCTKCYNIHSSDGNNKAGLEKKVDLVLDKRDDKLKVLCEEHVCQSSHLCGDGRFLCMYCVQRNIEHFPHSKNTLEVEVHLLKESLNNSLKDAEKFTQFQQLTERNVIKMKTKLMEVLAQRKAECTLPHNKALVQAETKLEQKFDDFVKEHMKQYDEGLIVDLPVYFKKILDKPEVEMLLQKEQILSCLGKYRNVQLKEGNILVLKPSSDPAKQQPLGDILKSADMPVPTGKTPFATLKICIIYEAEEAGGGGLQDQAAAASVIDYSKWDKMSFNSSEDEEEEENGHDDGIPKDEKNGNEPDEAKKKKKKRKRKKKKKKTPNDANTEDETSSCTTVAPPTVSPAPVISSGNAAEPNFLMQAMADKMLWVKMLSESDRHEWIVDCYRMRCDDDYVWGGCNFHGLLLACAEEELRPQMKLVILKDFLIFMKLAVKNGVIPRNSSFFSFDKCLQQAAENLQFSFEKSDAAERWGGENVFATISLRRSAEDVYGMSCQYGAPPHTPELGALFKQVTQEVESNVKEPFGQSNRETFTEVGGYRCWERLYRTMNVQSYLDLYE